MAKIDSSNAKLLANPKAQAQAQGQGLGASPAGASPPDPVADAFESIPAHELAQASLFGRAMGAGVAQGAKVAELAGAAIDVQPGNPTGAGGGPDPGSLVAP